MLIGQASIDENGTIRGTTPGDQTGNEINIRQFYSYPWNFVLRCKDEKYADKAATYMEEIARDSNFGYSQNNRWAGYNSIKSNGGQVSGARGDFDCSSLVISCYVLAGVPGLKAGSGYTGNMQSLFMNTGLFEVFTDSTHCANQNYMKRGDIYVNRVHHTVMGLENGPYSGASNLSSTIKPTTPTSSTTPAYSLAYKTKKENNYTELDFIKDIQSLGNTDIDGIVGPLTMGVTQTISKRRNSRHAFVAPIQLRLLSMGYKLPKYGVDGEFGSETEAAVKALQTDLYGAGHVNIDGEITARHNTWKKLLGVIK